VFTSGTPTVRSAEAIVISDAAIVLGDTGMLWLVTYREVDGKVTMVGNSQALTL